MANSVSLIITSYNQIDYLKDAVGSALAQSVPFHEVIVVDDAADDGSVSWLENVAAQNANVTVHVHNKNMAVGIARNSGLDLCTGTYVGFLDGDDMIEPHCHASWQNLVASDAPDMCVFGLNILDQESGTFVERTVSTPFAGEVVPDCGPTDDDDVVAACFALMPSAWRKLYRRGFLEDKEIRFQPGIYEDVLYHFQTLTLCETLTSTPEKLINYRKHSASVLRTPSRQHFALIEVFARANELMENHAGHRPALLEAFRRFRLRLLLFSVHSRERIREEDRQEFAKRVLSVPGLTDVDLAHDMQDLLASAKGIAGQK